MITRRRRTDGYNTKSETVEDARENLLSAIIRQAYDDLVFMHTMEQRYESSAKKLEEWFRTVLVLWVDVNPEDYIKRAKKEAEDVAKGISPESSDTT